MLTLPEEILLLSLDEEKGVIRNAASFSINYGLPGAALLELALQEKIVMQDNHLVVQDDQSDDPLLQKVLQELSKGKPQKLDHWISCLPVLGGKLVKLAYQKLVEKRIVEEEETRVLGLFPIRRHPVKNKKEKREICARIESVVFRRKKADVQTLCLLSLIQACGMFSLLFEKEKGKEAKARSQEILEKENARVGIEPSLPRTVEKLVYSAIQRTIAIACIAAGN